MQIKFLVPLKGQVADISKTPDDTFSQKLVGPGFVIHPNHHQVFAPVDGKVVMIFPTKHSLAIEYNQDLNILIHIGLVTGEFKGAGFDVSVKVGDFVKQGDLLLAFDPKYLDLEEKAISSPVVFMQKESYRILDQDIVDDQTYFTLEIN